MRRTVLAAACAAALALSVPTVSEASPARSCVKGAITGSAVVWVIALVAAPFSGGSSLAAAPAVDAVLWGSAIGCAAGMTGEAAADTLFPEDD